MVVIDRITRSPCTGQRGRLHRYAQGVAPGTITGLLKGDKSTIPHKMVPVLDFAKKLTQSANGVTKLDADAVLAVGWEETAVYHLVAVVALFNYMNRLVEGLGIELNPSYALTAAKRLADQGYQPLIALMKKPVETTKRND